MCATFTPDMTFSLHDRGTGRLLEKQGGRSEMCDYLHKIVPVMAKAISSENVTRDNFTMTRHGLHWWTADVSYTEHRDTTLGSKVHVKAISEDHLTLVKTFDGLLVKKLESEGHLDQ